MPPEPVFAGGGSDWAYAAITRPRKSEVVVVAVIVSILAMQRRITTQGCDVITPLARKVYAPLWKVVLTLVISYVN